MTNKERPSVRISSVQPPGLNLTQRQQWVHFATPGFRTIQFVLPAGKEIPTHEAEGEMILHCLQGEIILNLGANQQNLISGNLLYLALNEAFTIRAIQDSSVLMTILAPKHGENVALIGARPAE